MNRNSGKASAQQRIASIGLIAGLIAFAGMIIAPGPSGMPGQAWPVAAMAVLMAIFWVSEAVPLAATALIPVALLPVLQVSSIGEVASAYANPLIFLFLGGFLVARSMERWGLHRFIARSLTSIGSDGSRGIIAAIMLATAFLSMWISNTAAALVMLPIGQSIVTRRRDRHSGREDANDPFAPALMLGIAFSATIGGMTTLIGTPPNAIFAAFLKTSYGIEIGFAQWMLIGLPIAVFLLPATWLILTRVAFHIPGEARSEGDDNTLEIAGPAPLTVQAKIVAVIIIVAALALVSRPALQTLFPSVPITDAGIFIFAALVLFAIPAGSAGGGRLLSWEDAQTIRWDVLILVGGGIALASAIDQSGLSRWIGSGLTAFSFLPVSMIILLAMFLIVYLGELASNTAMAAVFLPIAGATALGMGLDPLMLVLPVALSASLGFMLPVATPPNAIVYGSGEVSNGEMMKAGSILDVGAILIVYAIAMVLGPYVFQFQELP